jgi:hypothetical protein
MNRRGGTKRNWPIVALTTLILILLGTLSGFSLYLGSASKHEVIVSGSGHGATIGKSRRETLSDLLTFYAGRTVVANGRYFDQAPSQFDLDSTGASGFLLSGSYWDLDLAEDHPERLQLRFRGDKLVKIEWARAPFTFP